MRFFASLGGNNLHNLPDESFSITDVLGDIATFDYEIENDQHNRDILAANLTSDFCIYREDDDMEVFSGKIDHDGIEYLSRHRIRVSGFSSEIELSDTLFKHLLSADAEAVSKVFDLDASGPTFTDFTTEANEATVNDVLPTWGAAGDILYIGQNETFAAVKVRFSTAGVYSATVVIEYWDGASWETLDCIDDSRGFSKAAGSYFVIIPSKPDDWTKTTINSEEKYWIRFRLSAWTSTTTAPKLDQIWIGDVDPLRVQFDNVPVDTILGYVLEGTDYSEDSTDQCPSDAIPMRGEYESLLRWIAAIAKACIWTDGDDNKHSYEWWIDGSKKVHFKTQRGDDKSSVEVDSRLSVLNNKQGYKIANRIYGAGSYDGISQKRAIIEDLASQDSYGLRETVRKDLRFSHETSLKDLIETQLSDMKAPLKEVSCVMETSEFLGVVAYFYNFPYSFPLYFPPDVHNRLNVGDTIEIYQPEWSVNDGASALSYRVMRVVIGPLNTQIDLGIHQTHLENIAANLQRQSDINDVWMSGATGVYPDSIELLATDDTPGIHRIYISENMGVINKAYLRYKTEPWTNVLLMNVLPENESPTKMWAKTGSQVSEISPAGFLHLNDTSDTDYIFYRHYCKAKRADGYVIKAKAKAVSNSNEYHSIHITGLDYDGPSDKRDWWLDIFTDYVSLHCNASTVYVSSYGSGQYGDGTTKTFNGNAGRHVKNATLILTDGVETLTDTYGIGTLQGDAGGSGTIDYITGAWSITFNTAPANEVQITGSFYYRDVRDREYQMDTTDDYHDYLILVKDTDIKVYVDGTLRIHGSGKYTASATGGSVTTATIYFGCGINWPNETKARQGEVLLDYFKYAEVKTADPDDLTLKVEVGEEGETLTEIDGSQSVLEQQKVDVTKELQAIGTDAWFSVAYSVNEGDHNVFSAILIKSFVYSK